MTKHISLRVPENLLERLRAAAVRNRRSLHGQVIWMLERGLEQDEGHANDVSPGRERPGPAP